MQLVLHAPFGSRVNKAWGLALRKRFCRQFDFELQAAATDEALLLSLGPQHSFPLSDVFRYLHPATARDVLVQAFLDAPVFQTRWRWNTTISLAVPRNRGGKKVPPQLQRMMAADLMAAAFPDAAACLDNIPGDRQIPDHPLVGADAARLPRGGDGLRRAGPRARPHSPGQYPSDVARHGRAVPARARDHQRAAVCVSRRCPARGAADAGRAGAPRAARRRRPTISAASTLRRSSACATRPGRIRATPTSCTTRCSAPAFSGPAIWPAMPRLSTFSSSTSSTRAAPRPVTTNLQPLTSNLQPLTSNLQPPTSGFWVAAERLPEILAVHPGAAIHGSAVPPPAAGSPRMDTRGGDRRGPARPDGACRADDGRSARGVLRDHRVRRERRASRARIRWGRHSGESFERFQGASNPSSNGAIAVCSRAFIATR